MREVHPTVGQHHLQRLGRLDDAGIAAELAGRPVFVSLARYEPFGLGVLEAASAGCARTLERQDTANSRRGRDRQKE